MLNLFFICILANSVLGNIQLPKKDTPPQWSATYYVRGVLNIPYAEINEPFSIWYTNVKGKSRIDYYGSMVKTYQLTPAAYPPFGASIKIAPITTEKVLNQQTCLQVNGTEDATIGVQSVLPDMSDFTFIGTDTMLNDDTSIWQFVHKIGEKTNKYTMWVKFKKNQGSTVPIPVRYEMKGFNSLLGSHYDHYYIDYTDYNVDDIEPGIFVPDQKMTCQAFPGPGVGPHDLNNPMEEFVHPMKDSHIEDAFDKFRVKHNKTYSNKTEHASRSMAFRHNLRFIHSTNRANRGFSVALNHMADWEDSEFTKLRGRRYTQNNDGLEYPYSKKLIEEYSIKLPVEWDWRLFGAVTPVKDQSVCGSCWSFGTTGAVEGAMFIANMSLTRLSQQALIDCSWGFGNNGCDGGEDFRSYQWIMKHGLPTEEAYGSYLGQDAYCHMDSINEKGDENNLVFIKSWVNVTANDEKALRLAIWKHGPISVSIDASHKTFSFYSRGVYYEPKCMNKIEQLDHAVLAVGYGILNGKKYWLVKNSWSNMWGNDGYVLMSSSENNCGVETAPTYVII